MNDRVPAAELRASRRTAVPPAQPEAWYSKTQACRTCRGTIVSVSERDGIRYMNVRHSAACPEVK